MQGFYRYNIFICHTWEYDYDYNNIINLIKDLPSVPCLIYSVPESEFLDDDKSIKKELIEELCKQIQPSDIVIVSSDIFLKNKDWITFQIEIATFFEKPIICIWTRTFEQIPEIIEKNACKIVDLDKFSITHAITKYASF